MFTSSCRCSTTSRRFWTPSARAMSSFRRASSRRIPTPPSRSALSRELVSTASSSSTSSSSSLVTFHIYAVQPYKCIIIDLIRAICVYFLKRTPKTRTRIKTRKASRSTPSAQDRPTPWWVHQQLLAPSWMSAQPPQCALTYPAVASNPYLCSSLRLFHVIFRRNFVSS